MKLIAYSVLMLFVVSFLVVLTDRNENKADAIEEFCVRDVSSVDGVREIATSITREGDTLTFSFKKAGEVTITPSNVRSGTSRFMDEYEKAIESGYNPVGSIPIYQGKNWIGMTTLWSTDESGNPTSCTTLLLKEL